MIKHSFQQAHIAIVDDEPTNVYLLEAILQREGYKDVWTTTDSRELCRHCESVEPDLILLDLMMPFLSGFEVIERLEAVNGPESYLPILVLTADITPPAKLKALAGGATDFLTKPFDTLEVALRIRNLLATRMFYLQLRERNRTLDQKVQERTAELALAQVEMLARLARAAEFRDDATGRHTERVGWVSELIARELGLPEDQVRLIRQAAPLHDLGKVGVSDTILLKPGRLTEDEYSQIKLHASAGGALLAGGRSELVQMAERIAATHHERWDGTGYPAGLVGEAIPLEGRILAVADVFDALTHARPYKDAWSPDDAMAEIVRLRGKHFDPRVVDAFVQVFGIVTGEGTVPADL